jgi:hypothetical protein
MTWTGHDRADSQLAEQLGGEPTDQPVELDLEFGGLPLAGVRPACGGPHSQHAGGLLDASSRGVTQPGAGLQQLSQRQPPEPLAKSVRGAGDQRMQGRDGRVRNVTACARVANSTRMASRSPHREADKLLIRPTRQPGPVPAARTDKSHSGHHQLGRSVFGSRPRRRYQSQTTRRETGGSRLTISLRLPLTAGTTPRLVV